LGYFSFSLLLLCPSNFLFLHTRPLEFEFVESNFGEKLAERLENAKFVIN
jgi:hypothetical protein